VSEEHFCDVVVVGGSLVGSSAAMFLAQQGLSVILVERRMAVSPHPRARGISVRTMELFRAAGIENEIRQVGEDDFTFVVGENLAGPHQSVPRPDTDAMSRLSPTTPYSCDQNRVEPILRRRAAALGAELWNGCTASVIEEHSTGVTVLVENASAPDHALQPEPPRRVTARYLIAADGANSRLRDDLGIGRHGQPVPGTGLSALFDANLDEPLRGRHVSALVMPGPGALLFPKGKVREHNWFGMVPREELDQVDSGGIEAIALSAIRSAVGDPDLKVTLRSVLTWKTGAYVADRYRRGRVFFVGDAAHVMPPYGGFGGNTGIADAHNLAWKLAAVCSAEAPGTLLDTYEQERQPIAEFTVRHVMTRGFGLQSSSPNSLHSQLTPTQVSLGYCYPSDGSVDKDWPVRDPSQDTGTPGMRAPHVRLRGPVSSTLDLLDPRGFTFLTVEGSPFASALQSRPVHAVRTCAVRPQDVADSATWHRVFGGPSPGLLVRPDGIVGWLAEGISSDPAAAVASARARCMEAI
jgi:putative polyketide hydroxylase